VELNLDTLVAFGASMAGSWITGRVQKNRTKLDNDKIPVTNTAGFGGLAAAITQDPMAVVGAVTGSLTASVIHWGYKKVRGR
jgi:hypothetical protein